MKNKNKNNREGGSVIAAFIENDRKLAELRSGQEILKEISPDSNQQELPFFKCNFDECTKVRKELRQSYGELLKAEREHLDAVRGGNYKSTPSEYKVLTEAAREALYRQAINNCYPMNELLTEWSNQQRMNLAGLPKLNEEIFKLNDANFDPGKSGNSMDKDIDQELLKDIEEVIEHTKVRTKELSKEPEKVIKKVREKAQKTNDVIKYEAEKDAERFRSLTPEPTITISREPEPAKAEPERVLTPGGRER